MVSLENPDESTCYRNNCLLNGLFSPCWTVDDVGVETVSVLLSALYRVPSIEPDTQEMVSKHMRNE